MARVQNAPELYKILPGRISKLLSALYVAEENDNKKMDENIPGAGHQGGPSL